MYDEIVYNFYYFAKGYVLFRLLRFRDSVFPSHSVADAQPSLLKIDVESDLNKNRPRDEKKNTLENLVEKENNIKGSSTPLQLSSETTKERPVISLFSKIQSINSSRSRKHSTFSPIHIHKSPVLAVDELLVVNVPSTMSVSFDAEPISNGNEPNETAPAKLGATLNIELHVTENQTKDPIAPNSDLNDSVNLNDRKNTVEPIEKHVEDETPYKIFQIPSTHRLLSSNRRLATNDMKKYRSALENEFRSQKVLFTTPSAVSRPIINLMNDAGLDDSLNCYKSSPVVIASTSENSQQLTVKRGLNEAQGTMCSHEATTVKKENKIVQNGDKNRIIRINGKDFFVHKKIGQGGSSSVFSAEHRGGKLECALKVCRI